ncbi:MAG: 3-hydroxyacyl-CoA dehydrogenase NAD-binding domain-containing protein [Geminicoccaceae bacterium]
MAGFKIAVIGAGPMGHGIALTMARAGHEVAVFDPLDEVRASVMDRIAASLRTVDVSGTCCSTSMIVMSPHPISSGSFRTINAA